MNFGVVVEIGSVVVVVCVVVVIVLVVVGLGHRGSVDPG